MSVTKIGDLMICKAGWVKFKEILSPRGKCNGVQIKYKAWKDVWLMLRKCGNYSELKTYPDSVKASSFTVEGYSICHEDFCGFEIGEFDGLPHVLAIITKNITYLMTPPDKKDKDEWVDVISQLFEEQKIYYVNVKKNSLIREGKAELRLLSTSVIITGNALPVCLGKWLISDVRRYGAGKDFVFELSQRFEEDKKFIVILSTTEAEAIKQLFDEMARSSSVVGHKSHPSISKSTKSMPLSQKPSLSHTLTLPKQARDMQPIQHNQSSTRQLNYSTIEFNNEPSQQIHSTSIPRGDYIAVDIVATEALHKAVQQSEHDNQMHAMELAKKLGPPYENNVMITTMSKLDPDPSIEGKMTRSEGVKIQTADQFTPSDFLPIMKDHRRSSDVSASISDYENVKISQNYENISLNPFEHKSSSYS
ncbi:Protein Dok-7 isoform X1 [Oopsacas minuta]|uniref:Protein Dok-7 isoform X1 n=1 Tax=Oopsacas minuta TaxID=111878 RepID=A0AAV7KBI9_9METZ|nr:Protein Dok-7 isoform X1 [Oopsacas minuta]